MNRGELWIGAETGYASKPRPALIVQSDRYRDDESVVTCLVTSHATDGSGDPYRVALPKSDGNGLRVDSFVMMDKIVAIPRQRLVKQIGVVEPSKMTEIYLRLIDFLAE